MFGIGNGEYLDLFDNGVSPTTGMNDGGFGVEVATADEFLEYVAGGVMATVPEPSTWAMMILGIASLGFAGYRSSRRGKAAAC